MNPDALAGSGLGLAVGALIPAVLLRVKVFLAENGVQPVRRAFVESDPAKRAQADARLEQINLRSIRWTRRLVAALLTVAVAGTVLLVVGLAVGGRP